MVLLDVLYTVAALVLALYGLNTLFLALTLLLRRSRTPSPLPVDDWPPVTVQLPIYNELHVATRLLYAVARFDYPRDRLEIQVLDDSDDETALALQRAVAHLRRAGINVHYLRRPHRKGYKAGALAYGLARAHGEFIALFDADFVPAPDWLRRTVPYLLHAPDVGFIQTRWEHLNASASAITLAQSLALDGHFAVEQPARQILKWPITFNGSAGLWRRSCIEDSGGWLNDTLCEDLDLAYRAQARGWKGMIVPEIAVPAEIPPLVEAFRQQQARWATGSIQVLRKHALTILRTPHLRLSARLQALLHMSNYAVHPLMLTLLLLTLPMMLAHRTVAWPLAYLSLAGFGLPAAYALAQWRLRGSLWRLIALPVIIFLGLGIAWTGTRAVWQGIVSRGTPFRRTPKFRLEGKDNRWSGKPYDSEARGVAVGEWLLAAYAFLSAGVAWHLGNVYAIPFMLLYALSFLTVAGGIWWQTRQQRKARLRDLSHPLSMEVQ